MFSVWEEDTDSHVMSCHIMSCTSNHFIIQLIFNDLNLVQFRRNNKLMRIEIKYGWHFLLEVTNTKSYRKSFGQNILIDRAEILYEP
jgi:hypothetical protein